MWTMRNKIKNGEWETLEPMYELEMELKDLCQQGHKIQSINTVGRTWIELQHRHHIEDAYTVDALSEQKS